MEGETVLSALDATIDKFKLWVPAVMKELEMPAEEIEKVKKIMARDTLVYIPFIRDALVRHHDAFEREDTEYFKNLLPAEYRQYEIPSHIAAKGFLYFQVLESLLNDLQ